MYLLLKSPRGHIGGPQVIEIHLIFIWQNGHQIKCSFLIHKRSGLLFGPNNSAQLDFF